MTIPAKLTLIAERNAMAFELIQAAKARGWEVTRDREHDRSRSMCFQGAELGVSLSLDPRWVPLLHWHGAKRDLVGVKGAWSGLNVNPHHRHKATSFPKSLEQVLDMLTTGMDAANDGTAFDD